MKTTKKYAPKFETQLKNVETYFVSKVIEKKCKPNLKTLTIHSHEKFINMYIEGVSLDKNNKPYGRAFSLDVYIDDQKYIYGVELIAESTINEFL